jgi:hypothetical protein
MATIFWRDMIKDILPAGNNGTVLVFHNPWYEHLTPVAALAKIRALACASTFCSSPTFTYRIDGSVAVYLGREDHHDPKYDGMVLSSRLEDLDQFSSTNSKYTGLPLNGEYCPYTVMVYPSATMELQYVSNNPIFITIGVLLIFGFSAVVFHIYDTLVERRQRKVMRAAVQSHAQLLKNARKATIAERELNDYIAYVIALRSS